MRVGLTPRQQTVVIGNEFSHAGRVAVLHHCAAKPRTVILIPQIVRIGIGVLQQRALAVLRG